MGESNFPTESSTEPNCIRKQHRCGMNCSREKYKFMSFRKVYTDYFFTYDFLLNFDTFIYSFMSFDIFSRICFPEKYVEGKIQDEGCRKNSAHSNSTWTVLEDYLTAKRGEFSSELSLTKHCLW